MNLVKGLLATPRRERAVSAAWFGAHVLPANDDSWTECEAILLADPHERLRVEELAAELSATGFDRPVVVERDRWWSPRLRVVDGVHRSLAAMSLDMPILMRKGYPDSAEYDHSDVYTVSAPEADPDDVMDAVLSLSSFRSSAGPWIQCDVASSSGDGQARLYLPRHPELRQLIAAELQERMRRAGIPAAVEFLENDPAHER